MKVNTHILTAYQVDGSQLVDTWTSWADQSTQNFNSKLKRLSWSIVFLT